MKVQWGDNFSLDTEMCNNDSLVLAVRGFGHIELEVGFKELTIRALKPGKEDEAKVEFTVPHETFSDGIPTIKIHEAKDGG